MKIHIVQKGETLWKLSKQYGVSFEQLKKLNTQLSNPDMIMPGMKIKIPVSNANVTKESSTGNVANINYGAKKEAPKPTAPSAAKKVKEAPIPVPAQPVKEAPMVKEKPIPVVQKTPQPVVSEIDINNYYMLNMANMSVQKPAAPAPIPPKAPQVPKMPAMPVIPKETVVVVEESSSIEVQQMPVAQECVPVTPIMPGTGFCTPIEPFLNPQYGISQQACPPNLPLMGEYQPMQGYNPYGMQQQYPIQGQYQIQQPYMAAPQQQYYHESSSESSSHMHHAPYAGAAAQQGYMPQMMHQPEAGQYCLPEQMQYGTQQQATYMPQEMPYAQQQAAYMPQQMPQQMPFESQQQAYAPQQQMPYGQQQAGYMPQQQMQYAQPNLAEKDCGCSREELQVNPDQQQMYYQQMQTFPNAQQMPYYDQRGNYPGQPVYGNQQGLPPNFGIPRYADESSQY